MSTWLLRLVFLVSLVVVAAGLRWLSRHPRGSAVRPVNLGGGPNVEPPPLPSPEQRAQWPATGYQVLGWIREGAPGKALALLEELAQAPDPADGAPPALDLVVADIPPVLAARPALDTWCRGAPDEVWPWLVRGQVLLEAGIRARSRQRRGTISAEDFETIQGLGRQAREDLQRARQLRVDLPLGGALATKAARFLGGGEQAEQADFHAAPEGARGHRARAVGPGSTGALLDRAIEQDRQARDGARILDRPAFEEAYRWMLQAAASGDPEALMRVGRVLRRAGRTEPERRAALDWFRLAATRGNPEAHFELGQCHMTGDGVSENRREAARWYRSAWELGSPWAPYMLAALARGGSGTRPDPGQVTLWLEEAAKLGHRDAQFEVGQRLLAGSGAPAAPDRGRAWIHAAAQGGHAKAQQWLERPPGDFRTS